MTHLNGSLLNTEVVRKNGGQIDTTYVRKENEIIGKVDYRSGKPVRHVHMKNNKKTSEWCLDGKVTVQYDAEENRLSEDFRLNVNRPPAIRFSYGQENAFIKIEKLHHNGTTEYSAVYRDFLRCELTVHQSDGTPEMSLQFEDNATEIAYLEDGVVNLPDFTILDSNKQKIEMEDAKQRAALFSKFQQGWNDCLREVALPAKFLAHQRYDSFTAEKKQDKERVSKYALIVKKLQHTV